MLTQKKLAKPLTACWAYLNSPNVAEILGQSGFNVIVIDQEHSPWSASDSLDMMRAIKAAGAIAAVRIPEVRVEYMKSALDSGAEIILAPDIKNADQAKELSDFGRYPPNGKRGAAHLTARAANWGSDAQSYIANANDEIVLVAMIETLEGVNCVEEICAVNGIDAVMVGVVDLAIDLAGIPDAPDMGDCIKRVEAAARDHNRALVGVDRPTDPASQQYERGYWMVTLGNDTKFLRDAAKKTLAD